MPTAVRPVHANRDQRLRGRAVGPNVDGANGNIGALTRRVPTDGVGTPSAFPQASDRDGMQVLAEGEARLPVIEHDTCGETRTRRLA